VSREQTLANTEAWLDRLNTSALHSAGDDTVRLIDTGNRLIQGLKGAGHIDETAARDMQRHWVQNYAKAWIEMRPPQERLALLGDGGDARRCAARYDRREHPPHRHGGRVPAAGGACAHSL
jgi:uncharacterized membrane protein YccC